MRKRNKAYMAKYEYILRRVSSSNLTSNIEYAAIKRADLFLSTNLSGV